MIHPAHQELISAYFDGENTAAERAEAERLLAEDPDARAWWEELRQVRGEIQSLPCFELEEHFADHVLRRAERALLLEAAEPAWDNAKPDFASADAAVSRNGKPSSQRFVLPAARTAGVRWYGPAWLAVAASLLLFAGLFSGSFFQSGSGSWRLTNAGGGTHRNVQPISQPPTKAPVQGGIVAPAPTPELFLSGKARADDEPAGNKDGGDPGDGEDVYYFALGTAESVSGQVVVVCDVNGQPRNAVADFEKLLNKRQKIDRQLGLSYAGVSPEGEEETDGLEGKQASDELTTTRVYYVSMAPQQLAATLREVTALGNSEISISGFSAPKLASRERAKETLARRHALTKKRLTDQAEGVEDQLRMGLASEAGAGANSQRATPTIFVLRLNKSGRGAAPAK